jgi:hypothetical protein
MSDVNCIALTENAKVFKNSPAPTNGFSGLNTSLEKIPFSKIYFAEPI